MTTRLPAIVLCAAAVAAAGDMPAEAIMQRVADNQARAVEARSRWIHRQETFIRLSRTNGRMAREETKELVVLPAADSVKREMVRFEGRYADGKKIVPYTEPGFKHKGMDIDAELAGELPDELVGERSSRDGIGSDFFPLTAEQQRKYRFKLLGTQEYKDRNVYQIAFEPQAGETAWAGEALIDTEEFQPVLVTTFMKQNLPLFVRAVLGTDLKHLGFKLEYTKLEDGVWFPVKYAGEFKLNAVFFYRRNIAIHMRSFDFRKADVQSTIEYSGVTQ